MKSKTVLVLLQDGSPVHSFTLKQKAHLGRTPDADLSVMDPTVSTDHARVWLQGEQVYIRDLGSTNGTFVNGGRVVGRKPLGNGDSIRLGRDTHIKVKMVAQDGSKTQLALEDIAGGVRRPLEVGDNEINGVNVQLSEAGVVTVEGEAFAVGSIRRVGAGRWRLVTDTEPSGPTMRVEFGKSTFPYRVETSDKGVNIVHLEPARKAAPHHSAGPGCADDRPGQEAGGGPGLGQGERRRLGRQRRGPGSGVGRLQQPQPAARRGLPPAAPAGGRRLQP